MLKNGVSHDALTKEEIGNRRFHNFVAHPRGRPALRAHLLLPMLCVAVALLSACGTSSPSAASTSTATAAATATTTVSNPSTVFVVQNGNSDGSVLALNAADGSVKWRSAAFAGGLGLGSLALSQGVVLAAENNGPVVVLRAQDGVEIWNTGAVRYPNSMMVVDGETVYIASGSVDAYRVTDGVLLWHYTTADCGAEFLAAASGMVVASPGGCSNPQITALSERDGSVLWQHPTQNFGAQVTIANGVVYTNQTGIVTALDATTGATKWQYTPPQLIGQGGSSVSVSDQTVIAEAGISILALRSQDGSVAWSADFQHIVNGHTAVGNIVYVSNAGATTVTALRLSDGGKLWQASLDLPQPWSPVAENGVLYVSVDSGASAVPEPGMLYAIRMSDGAVLWHHMGDAGNIGVGVPVVG